MITDVGPPGEQGKYRIDSDRGPMAASGVQHLSGWLEVGGEDHLVDILLFDGVAVTDAERWLSEIEQSRLVQEEALVVPREAWFDASTQQLFVALNHVEGEPLSEWIAARPNRDPIGSISSFISLAASVDALHHDYSTVEAHGALATNTIVMRHDQVAVAAAPPLPAALAHRIVPDAFASPGGDVSAEGDTFAVAGVIVEMLTGAAPEGDIKSLRGQLHGFSARPDLIERIVAAREVDEEKRPALLVNWLARLRGATVLPGEMAEVVTAPLENVVGWKRRATSTRSLLLLSGLVLATVSAAFFVGQRSAQPSAAIGLRCDPDEQAEVAQAEAAAAGFKFAWNDTDGDCFHDSYEIHWIGSDYLIPDASDSTFPSPASQMRVLRNFYNDTTQIRGLNPTACETELVADLANAFIERTGLVVTWVDTDGDCMHDAYESNAIGTDPLNPDSDGDGYVDSVDVEAGSGGMLKPLDTQIVFVAEVHERNHIDHESVDPTDPIQCHPGAWERAAVTYLLSSELPYEWLDPDGDCLHSEYEEIVTFTDPDSADSDSDGIEDGNDPDHGDGMIEPIDRQFDVVGLGS